jgi:phospholipase/carboxylesterase
MTNPHARQELEYTGASVEASPLTVVLVHGRALDPDYMVANVYDRLERPDLSFVLPCADGHSWYPTSFLSPLEENEPRLTFALERLEEVRAVLESLGRRDEEIVWLGFAQGACLCCEYVARSPRRFAGVIAFTGGLIGPDVDELTEPKGLDGMPMLMTTSDVDPLVPVERVEATAAAFRDGGADVELLVLHDAEHEVTDESIVIAREFLERLVDES